jgi:phosphatidylglycerol:prolipoprotein diacylglycerol transferase
MVRTLGSLYILSTHIAKEWYDNRVIAFYLPGNIPIYTFSILLALGAFLGMVWVIWQSSDKDAPRNMVAGIWTLLGALVGSRIVFVVFNWPYFRDHPWESLQVYLGGLSWPGALMGSLIALGIYVGVNHLPFVELVDVLVPLLVCLSVAVWLGCWLAGCFYGAAIPYWWGIPSTDEWGQVVNRSPVQLIGAVFTVGLFWSADRAVRRGNFRPGTLACLGFLNLSLISFGLSFLRVDPVLSWRVIHLDAWASLIFASVGLAGLLTIYSKKKGKT